MKLLRDKRHSLWGEIVDLLTLSQYEKTMGGDMTWYSKAFRAKEVSTSKRVHKLANALIAECERIARDFIWFQGAPFERKELVITLIHAHVIAVMERDHDEAQDIEDYLWELKLAPTREEIYHEKCS